MPLLPTRRALAAVAVAAGLVLGACGDELVTSTEPLRDGPPYICGLVPRADIDIVSGGIDGIPDGGAMPPEGRYCTVHSPSESAGGVPKAELTVWVSRGPGAVDLFRQLLGPGQQPVATPNGWLVSSARIPGALAGALLRSCAKQPLYISVVYAGPGPVRDSAADAVALVTSAATRFDTDIAHCPAGEPPLPKPAASPPAPTPSPGH